jgi:hypothetical protein
MDRASSSFPAKSDTASVVRVGDERPTRKGRARLGVCSIDFNRVRRRLFFSPVATPSRAFLSRARISHLF